MNMHVNMKTKMNMKAKMNTYVNMKGTYEIKVECSQLHEVELKTYELCHSVVEEVSECRIGEETYINVPVYNYCCPW